jgi:SAM-dependent methyltransferase
VASALDEARAAFAADDALLTYVSNCGEQLAEVLTGKESPLETLFPGGSGELAAGLYETSPVARYFNGIARAAVAAASGRFPGRTCRLLEIGAGTGGTTAALLPVLRGDVSYTFTDIGSLFLSKARDRFSAYPFVGYAQLDLEREPADQGFLSGSYDVVVAANVLHATRNLHTTMDRALGLLRPGGLLVLLETTCHPSWFDISTGLIHGWQVFEDELRADHPLIDADRWQPLLREHGAEAVEAYPSKGSAAEILGQHVILARRSVAAAAATMPATCGAIGIELPGIDSAPAAAGASTDVRARLTVVSSEEADELLVDFVRQQVAGILRLDPATLDPGARLMDLGVDSLMAVELRNLLAAGLQLKRRPSATLIFDYPTVRAIAGHLRRDVLKLAPPRDPEPIPGDAVRLTEAAVAVGAMDDLAIEALLNKTLETL